MAITDRIRDARQNAGLSINALAKKVGVSSTAAWHWDCGNTSPRDDKVPDLAKALGVSEAYLRGANVAPSPAQPPAAGKTETLDHILTDAQARIAALLGIKQGRVAVTFNLKD